MSLTKKIYEEVSKLEEFDWRKGLASGLIGLSTMAGTPEINAQDPVPAISNIKYDIDYDIIKQIESGNNPKAFNKSSGARGLYQITPIVLAEWNKYNKTKYKISDLFDKDINEEIAIWYFDRLRNHYFPYYSVMPTIDNLLIAYNWGIGNLKRYLRGKTKLPKETSDYIQKYKKMAGK